MRSLGWALIQYDCILIRGKLDTDMYSDHVKIQREDKDLQTKERSLKKLTLLAP
jgi:hypothetical protein